MTAPQPFLMQHAVLFVDDEAAMLNSIRRDLRKESYDLFFSTDPREALTVIEKHRPGVVVSDLNMPGMDGVAFLQQARRINPKMVGMILSAHTGVEQIMAAVNEGHVWRYITKPWEANDLMLAVRNALDLFETELQVRFESYRALAELAEIRDETTGRHLRRMGLYSRILAEQLGCSKHFSREIEAFAMLHDVGKVGIPDHILRSTRKLSAEEFEVIKNHTTLGYNILKDKPAFKMGAEIAYYHHEHYGGGGYPRQLTGEAIPFAARIVALADVYDALRHRRPYKAPWDHEVTVEHIAKESGRHFDPRIVDAFKARAEEFAAIVEPDFQPVT